MLNKTRDSHSAPSDKAHAFIEIAKDEEHSGRVVLHTMDMDEEKDAYGEDIKEDESDKTGEDEKEDEYKIASEDQNKDEIEKTETDHYILISHIVKLCLTSIAIIIAIIMIIVPLNIYKIICLFCIVYSTIYITSLLVLITSAKQLHLVQFNMIEIYGHKAFTVPNQIETIYNQCIKSISDILTLPGSPLNPLFLVGNYMQYTLTLIAIIIKIKEWTNTDENVPAVQWISVYFFFLYDIGMLIRVIWNKMEHSKLSSVMHYIGAFCVFCLGSLSFMLYQNFTFLSVMLAAIQLVTAMYYFALLLKCPHKHEDEKLVSRISYWCIVAELIASGVSLWISNLYLWCMDGDTIMIF